MKESESLGQKVEDGEESCFYHDEGKKASAMFNLWLSSSQTCVFQLAAEKKKCLSLFHRSLTPKDRCSVKTGSNTNEVIAYSETFHNHTMQAAKITDCKKGFKT